MKTSKRLKKLRKLAEFGERLPMPSGPTPIKAPLDVVTRFAKAWNDGDATAIGELFEVAFLLLEVLGAQEEPFSPQNLVAPHGRVSLRQSDRRDARSPGGA